MTKKETPQDALVAWVKIHRPEMYAQIVRWFEGDPNATTASLAGLAMMGFEAGREFERQQKQG